MEPQQNKVYMIKFRNSKIYVNARYGGPSVGWINHKDEYIGGSCVGIEHPVFIIGMDELEKMLGWDKTCSDCAFFNGEECGAGGWEGSQVYGDEVACSSFEESKE